MDLFKDKQLKDLTLDDLKAELTGKEIREGFFVDYKREMNKDIWKHVASFANTYGGYIFIGIEENADKLPTGFDGIPFNGDVLERLRALIEGNVHPFPSIEIVPVKCSDTHSIIIVRIYEDSSTPYICNNGVIYQRNNDASSPVTDRYVLDKLYEKAKFLSEAKSQRLSRTITHKHFLGSPEWKNGIMPNKYVYSVLIIPPQHQIGEIIFRTDIEMKTILNDIQCYGPYRTTEEGLAKVYNDKSEKVIIQSNWWTARDVNIVYRDGIFEFISQYYNTLQKELSCFDIIEIIQAKCSKATKFLADRIKIGKTALVKIYIMGTFERQFRNDRNQLSFECDHGIIELEYAYDLKDNNQFNFINNKISDDLMGECGGISNDKLRL
ncbi:MAG: ATP-binding protein [Kiritimatiellae bacterium]|nr:ATP-binding protein [Kiritimatiellia bacterium]